MLSFGKMPMHPASPTLPLMHPASPTLPLMHPASPTLPLMHPASPTLPLGSSISCACYLSRFPSSTVPILPAPSLAAPFTAPLLPP